MNTELTLSAKNERRLRAIFREDAALTAREYPEATLSHDMNSMPITEFLQKVEAGDPEAKTLEDAFIRAITVTTARGKTPDQAAEEFFTRYSAANLPAP